MRDTPLILAVDDTPENLEILRMRLEAQGYEVAEAIDGEDGLTKARELKPDLILLDVMMPKLDGIEAVRLLKNDTDLRSIPVILVTAKADTKDVVQGLDAGGDDYLTKPFEHAALLARVRSLLRQKALHDKVQEQAREITAWNAELEARVKAQVADIERMSRLRRFLSPQVAEMVTAAGDYVLESHRREVTVVFCDLRGFTSFAESSEPEEVMAVLRDYHACLGALIQKHEGTLERFVGDGLLVLFNDPFAVPGPLGARRRHGAGNAGTAWERCRTAGGAAAMNSGSASGSRRATPRLGRSGMRVGPTMPPSAAFRIWLRDYATRPPRGKS